MRVISGSARGIQLKTIEGIDTRPTTDRVKESLFNLIQHEIYDQRTLDLFSGSGSLGIEAASRGASEVVLVEQSKKCEKVIKDNLEKTRLTDRTRLLVADVDRAIERLRSEEAFHLILMDPPYNRGLIQPTVEKILACGLLSQEGLVVVEYENGEDIPEEVGDLVTLKLKKYGRTMVRIYGRP